jgi:putative ABC transport system ATP-binding protein
MTGLLAVSGVTKGFGRGVSITRALRGADLAIDDGDIVAVVGPSGSGKSTLLHIAAGILPPDNGTVRFRGQDLSDMTDGQRSSLRRNEFGFVFQFGQLIGELTCLENVALPLRLNGTPRRAAEGAASEWMNRLGVADICRQRPSAVSGGQAQRVAVARALVTAPSVIFADEPTGALDTLQGEQVMSLLVQTVRSTGAALVLITHEPRVAAFADREVLVRDGRTAGVGAVA